MQNRGFGNDVGVQWVLYSPNAMTDVIQVGMWVISRDFYPLFDNTKTALPISFEFEWKLNHNDPKPLAKSEVNHYYSSGILDNKSKSK